MSVTVHHGDNRDVIKTIADCSIDSVVTDPPYALVSIVQRGGGENAAPAKGGDAYSRASAGFMGKKWDTGEVAFDPAFWREIWRVLKPGGHVVAFGGTRSFHRLTCAIEDAGFEIRDRLVELVAADTAIAGFLDSLTDAQAGAFFEAIEASSFSGELAWIYGSGFPKSHDAERAVAMATCQAAGRHYARALPAVAEREPGDHVCEANDESRPWTGFGTALKPAVEPIVLARKALAGTVAANLLAHGGGALNIDATRICGANDASAAAGRWPPNVVLDGSVETVAGFPREAGGGAPVRAVPLEKKATVSAFGNGLGTSTVGHADSGSAARFFYSAKASAEDRIGSKHPTIKPVDLMAWLVRLVTPPGGVVLGPFAGSGSTGGACIREGFDAILIEREAEYVADIRRRIARGQGLDSPLFAAVADSAADPQRGLL